MINYQDIFWGNIQKIQDILALKNAEVAELLELSSLEYVTSKLKRGPIDLQRMDAFLDRVGMSLDTFFEGHFDKDQIQNFYYGELDSLPARYDFAKYSKARTIINCLTYIELKYGPELKNSIVRSLNMDIRFFEDPERVLNIKLLKDLCVILKNFGLTDQDFVDMGRMSHYTNKSDKLGQILSSHRNMEDMMHDICDRHSTSFDQNFEYFVTGKDEGEISIGFKPTEYVLEHLGHFEIVSDQVCLTKRGVFSAFPLYLDYDKSYVKKTKCMLEGDNHYEYKIFYSKK